MVFSHNFGLVCLSPERFTRNHRSPDARIFNTPRIIQLWHSPITDVLHPRYSLPNVGFEETVDDWAQLRSAYERQDNCVLFSKLPGELRNKIYQLLLVSDESVTPQQQLLGLSKAMKHMHHGGYKPAAGLDATLLQTCRAIHHEALPILYGSNTFMFNKSVSMWQFGEYGLPRVEEGTWVFE